MSTAEFGSEQFTPAEYRQMAVFAEYLAGKFQDPVWGRVAKGLRVQVDASTLTARRADCAACRTALTDQDRGPFLCNRCELIDLVEGGFTPPVGKKP